MPVKKAITVSDLDITTSHFVKFMSSERRIYASEVPLVDYYTQAKHL